MQTLDLAVVGSGMGGSMISALNKDKNIILFEKDNNLGGCASTFKRHGSLFNAGATTFVGYEKNHPVKKIFDFVNAKPQIQKSELAISIIQNGKVLNRVKDFEVFLEDLEKIYPNKNNRIFWKKLKEIDEKFWSLKKIYFSKYSLNAYVKTFDFILELLSTFGKDLFKSAQGFIKETLCDIDHKYEDFIDAQLLITIQTTSKDISLLSLALGLSYPFHDVFYVKGGMGTLFDELLKDVEVHKKEEVLKIIKEKNLYKIITKKEEYLSKKVVLNSTIFDSEKLFEDKKIKNYYKSFSFSNQSAFVVNLLIDTKENLHHHYQIIEENFLPNAISKSFFISVSSNYDEILSKKGLSLTISTHTEALFWKNLSKEVYEEQKEVLQEYILKSFLENFTMISKEDILYKFSGTANTFNRYINRFNCAGRAITFKNILQTPSCTTPYQGLYNVGDTIFAGQGWPGIALGVEVLNKEING